MSFTLSVVVFATSLLAGLPCAYSQSSTAVCASSYQWAFNSRQQSPCVVAAYLQGACNNGDFSIEPLPAASHYVGPTRISADPCTCNSVVYSLVSACADCQSRTYISWSSWNANCSGAPHNQEFPQQIPSGTAVPGWAYLDVLQSDRFDPIAAKSNVNKPESSGSGGPTGSSTGGATSTGSRGTATSKSGTKKSSNNIGAIAGGVVAGVVALGLVIGLAIFFFLRHKKAQTAPSAAYNTVTPLSPPAMGQHGSDYSYQSSTPFNPSFPESYGVQQRPYDPADPSTFPVAAPAPTIHTTHTPPPTGYYDGRPGQGPPPGAYSGVPEL